MTNCQPADNSKTWEILEPPRLPVINEHVSKKTGTGRKVANLKNNFLDIAELIRSIQRAEGNPDCFGKAPDGCDRLDCAWRPYCLKESKSIRKKHDALNQEPVVSETKEPGSDNAGERKQK